MLVLAFLLRLISRATCFKAALALSHGRLRRLVLRRAVFVFFIMGRSFNSFALIQILQIFERIIATFISILRNSPFHGMSFIEDGATSSLLYRAYLFQYFFISSFLFIRFIRGE